MDGVWGMDGVGGGGRREGWTAWGMDGVRDGRREGGMDGVGIGGIAGRRGGGRGGRHGGWSAPAVAATMRAKKAVFLAVIPANAGIHLDLSFCLPFARAPRKQRASPLVRPQLTVASTGPNSGRKSRGSTGARPPGRTPASKSWLPATNMVCSPHCVCRAHSRSWPDALIYRSATSSTSSRFPRKPVQRQPRVVVISHLKLFWS